MSGPMTSSRIAPTMGADIGCSTCSTSSPTNVWRSVSPASSRRSMLSTFCPTCSSCGAFPLTSAPTTDRSSSPRRCRNGSRWSVPRPPTSSGAAPGRTATSRASTPAFAMSCSTARFSTLCARPRSSSRVGDATTTRSGPTPQLDTSHQHQRCSCPHSPRGRLRSSTGFAGHAGATANLKLTFHLDHSAGADQPYLLIEGVDLLFQDLGQFPASRRALLGALGADSPITVIATARYPEKLKAEEVAAFIHIIPLMFPSAEDREALLRHAAGANEATISTLVEQTEWWTPKEVLDFGREVSNDFSPAAVEAALARHGRSVNVPERRRTAAQVLEFTMSHCTEPKLREELRQRFGKKTLEELESSVELRPGLFGVSVDLIKLLRAT